MAVIAEGVGAFARGFLLAERALAPPVPGWVSEPIAGLHLSRAPELDLTRAEHDGACVAVLGHLVDTGRWLTQPKAVAAAAVTLARSEAAFLDVTDGWSGRYLLLFGRSGAWQVMTDAAGMRSAFHALEGPLVLASHARLVADVLGAPPSPIVAAYREVKAAQPPGSVPPYPGRSTPWVGVVALTANVALDVGSRRLRRVHPRGPVERLDVDSVAAMVAPLLRGQIELLVASGRPVALSVTAGRDSRVSLAASRSRHDAIDYFTYARAGLVRNDWDVAAASSMAAAAGLSHRVLAVPSAHEPAELLSAVEAATITTNGRAYVGAYRSAFASDTIHVRSNIGEVGRSYYRRHRHVRDLPTEARDLTPEVMASLWGHGTSVSEPVVAAFDDWMQAVAFADIEGVDGLDMLYWEHRMACWHANALLASDFAFDSHVLFNARSILMALLAVPLDDRIRSRVFKRLVATLWSELRDWPYREEDGPLPVGPFATPGRGRRMRRLLGR